MYYLFIHSFVYFNYEIMNKNTNTENKKIYITKKTLVITFYFIVTPHLCIYLLIN